MQKLKNLLKPILAMGFDAIYSCGGRSGNLEREKNSRNQNM
jgi:hypothetical protein